MSRGPIGDAPAAEVPDPVIDGTGEEPLLDTEAADQEGRTVARAVAVSTSFQIAAKVVHLALNIVSSLALIRYMTPAGYGDYVLVLTVTSLLGLLSDFGMDRLAIREVGRDQESEGRIIGTVIGTRLLLAAVAFGLVQAVLMAMGEPATVRAAAAVISLLFVGEALLTVVVTFHVRLEQEHEALVRTVGEAIETALILWLITRDATLIQIVTAPVVGAAVAVLLAFAISRRRYRVRVRFDPSLVKYLVREALPIGPAMIIGVIYLKLDSFMLANLRPSADVGIYGAAFQPIEYLIVAMSVPIHVLFPLLIRYLKVDRARYQRLYQIGTETMLALLLPVPVILAVLAPRLVTAAFGSDFAASADPMRVLAIVLVPVVLSVWHGFVLLAAGKQHIPLRYLSVALVVSAVLNGALIPFFGYMGAAFATLAATSTVGVWSARSCARHADAHLDLGRLLRIVVAAALSLGLLVILVSVGMTPWLAPLAVLVAYPGALWALRVATPDVVRAALRAARSREGSVEDAS